MFHILGILFIVIIAILIIGLSIIGAVIRSVFGLKGRRSSSGSRSSNSSQSMDTEPEESDNHSKRKKLFSKDEGEYVDFEEVKD